MLIQPLTIKRSSREKKGGMRIVAMSPAARRLRRGGRRAPNAKASDGS